MSTMTATHTFVTSSGRHVVEVVIEHLDRAQWVEQHGQAAKRFTGSNAVAALSLDGVPSGRTYLAGFSLAVALEDRGRDLARGLVVRR